MYHNIESINSHYQDLLNAKSFMAADIICLVKTQNEESIDYKIPGYYSIYNSNKQPSIKIHCTKCAKFDKKILILSKFMLKKNQFCSIFYR
jgi:hypothetical protein